MTSQAATNSDIWQSLWINVNVATMTDGATSYGAVEQAALATAKGKIVWLGKMSELPEYNAEQVTVNDGAGAWLTPGLVDCHTHLVYGGNRANEFEMRLQGASYQEIAKAGGGIVSTVSATRSASEKMLFDAALPRITSLFEQGVSTIEIKSGYGLNTETESKMLKVAGQLAKALPIKVQRTFLGAHALPIEYKDRADDYIKLVCEEMLPIIAKQKLADAVDVFCEGIGFNLSQTEQVFIAAKKHDLPIKIHAEQLSNLGGSALASDFNALSADHIEYLDEAGVIAMSKAGTCAVLLPGAFYFLRETQLPPIELLRKHNVPMAIATDANPGSSPIHSLQLMLNMACTLFQLTPVEALAGVTCHGAQALGLAQNKGKIALGYDADFALWNISQPAELCYQFGVNPLKELVTNGQIVINNNG